MLGQPQTYVLLSEENVWDVAVEDINGDGVRDIFAAACDETSHPLRKYVGVYPGAEDAAYGRHPAFQMELDPAASTLFFAETDGAPPRELVAADAYGATVYGYESGAFRKRTRCEFHSLWPSFAREPVFVRDAAKDLNGDGVEEWLVPVATGFEVRTAEGLAAEVHCDVMSETDTHEDGATYIIHRLPAYHFFESEPVTGLAFLSDDFADFAWGDGWTQRERFEIPLDLEEKWDATTRMADISNNGFPDLLVTQTSGTVRVQALTHVYVAEAPFKYPQEPTGTFHLKGAIASPIFKDVDGDGCKDIVLVSVSFGVRNVINFFVRGKLTVGVDMYCFNGTDFGDEPAYHTNLTMDAPDGRQRVAYVMGDFNGDGRLDAAFGQNNDRLDVHTGEEGRFVSRRPWVSVEVPSHGTARACKLNENGASDIVLFHAGGSHSKRVDVLVF